MNRTTWFGYSEPPHIQNVSAMFAFQFLNLLTILFVLYKFTAVWFVPRSVTTFIGILAGLYALNYYATGASDRARCHPSGV